MEATPVLIEKLNTLVSQLPPYRLQEVVDFADFLLARETGAVADQQTEDDPLLGIIGMFDSGIDDLAENHHKYLAEFYAKDNNI